MKILFQGDSITDAGRDKRNYHDMGNGYPKYASQLLKDAFPKVDFEFINLGISGNRTAQLSDRLYTDAIALEPDIVSIMIGINDIFHRHDSNHVETTDEQVEINYKTILMRLRNQTNAKIVVFAPYLLECENREAQRADLERLLPIMSSYANLFSDVYIPTDRLFEEALKVQPYPKFYSRDGVHPNDEGAKFIGKQYFEAVAPIIKQMLESKNEVGGANK